MAEKDRVTMSQRELRRLHFVKNAIGKVITQAEAAEAIEISERQVRRIVRKVREEGETGIVHGSRGRPSNHATSSKLKTKVLDLFKKQYPDFGPTLASEKLLERDKIVISDETLRLWLLEAKIPYKQRKKRPHREWRERKARLGEMVQTDGSHHDWFEGRGPKCVLMGYIDDATGRPWGRFEPYEGTLPAMRSLRGYIKRYGIPASLYLDKHMTYRSPKEQTIEDELAGRRAMSQFQRAAEELGINVIHANSPQAKGRVERLFRTFQDRLIKEMRLENICGIEEGNQFLARYLPVYYKRFGVVPSAEGDIHRPLSKGLDLARILCIKTERVLRKDFTVAHEGKLYQVLDNIQAKKALVEERMDETMVIRHREQKLRFKPILVRAPKLVSKPRGYIFSAQKARIPSFAHPWRRMILTPKHSRTEELLTAQT
jgi:Integrase core domain.